jgi:hypothetical protein
MLKCGKLKAESGGDQKPEVRGQRSEVRGRGLRGGRIIYSRIISKMDERAESPSSIPKNDSVPK